MAQPGQDWRLRADLQESSRLDELLARLRARRIDGQLEAQVGDGVVVTHDETTLFVYAADSAELEQARRALEDLLAAEQQTATISVARWSEQTMSWRSPDATTPEDTVPSDAQPDSDQQVTETIVASAGRLVQADFQTDVLDYAGTLGVQCEVLAHPHLLTTQLAFTAIGPRGQVAALRDWIHGVAGQTIRADEAMLSPFGGWSGGPH